MPDPEPGAMSSRDPDKIPETPERSFGAFSLLSTGGELLEDIHAEGLLLNSPAPGSLAASLEYGNANHGVTNVSSPRFMGIRRFFGGLPEPLHTRYPDFDSIPLLDDETVSEALESIDWLVQPPGHVPENFDENDRSFLDTHLLYNRNNLLNFVTRVINEEQYAQHRRKSPPPLRNSNLTNEVAGSGATFRVNRQLRRNDLRDLAGRLDGAAAVINDSQEENPARLNAVSENQNIPVFANGSSRNHSEENDSRTISRPPPKASSVEDRRQKYLTYSRRHPIQRQYDVDSEIEPTNNEGGASAMQMRFSSSGDAHETNNPTAMNRIRKDSFESTFDCHPSENGFIPDGDTVSPTGPPGGSRLTADDISPISSPALDARKFGIVKPIMNQTANLMNEPTDDEQFEAGMYSQQINTRTYTRPKKTRMSLGTPNYAHNNPSPLSSPYTSSGSAYRGESTPMRLLNTTIELSPVESGTLIIDSASNPLNQTIDLGTSNTSLSSRDVSSNLNETFVSDTPKEREKSRRVTRNLSYVVRREDGEESPNNNSSPQGPHVGGKSDLNNTFVYDPYADNDTPVTRSSQNTSMEDLNYRVASQIRSLGCSTISRGKVPDGIGRAGLDETRLVARTSSTDTYSVAQSSESPTSSGLSSPLDAQSYDDIQSSESSVRRSMPNLALIKSSATTSRPTMAYPMGGSGQLIKNHYISDSKLSRLGINDRPRLSVHSSSSSNTATLTRGHRPNEGLRAMAVDRNTSTPASLNRIPAGISSPGAPRVYSAQALGSATITRTSTATAAARQSGMGNVRSTALVPPRYSSASATAIGATSGLRPPRAGSHLTGSSSVPGIPVPTFRTQSRIPAPGRLSRPPASRLPCRGASVAKPVQRGGGGGAKDWRDGCY